MEEIAVQGVSVLAIKGSVYLKALAKPGTVMVLKACCSVEYCFLLVAKPTIANGVVLLGELTDHLQSAYVRPYSDLMGRNTGGRGTA